VRPAGMSYLRQRALPDRRPGASLGGGRNDFPKQPPEPQIVRLRGYAVFRDLLAERPLPRVEPPDTPAIADRRRYCPDRRGFGHPVGYLIREACERNWCCTVGCTTCGCMKFRTIARDLPGSLVREFLDSPQDVKAPRFDSFRSLLVFHPLPRSLEEEHKRAEAHAEYWAAETQRREVVRAQAQEAKAARRAEKARQGLERHRERQAAGEWRRELWRDLAGQSLVARLERAMEFPSLPIPFFVSRPADLSAELLATVSPACRAGLGARLSRMHTRDWRERGLR
jgi:hypothetical protein